MKRSAGTDLRYPEREPEEPCSRMGETVLWAFFF